MDSRRRRLEEGLPPCRIDRDRYMPAFCYQNISSFTEAVISRTKVGSPTAGCGSCSSNSNSSGGSSSSSIDIHLTSTIDITAHRTVSYGSRKPDVVFYETPTTVHRSLQYHFYRRCKEAATTTIIFIIIFFRERSCSGHTWGST